MVNVSIDVTDLGGEARPGDKVVFWRPRMGGSATHAGRVISTAPVTVFLTNGKATVSDVEPGEMTVLLQCRGVESQGPVTVGVPDGNGTVTLRSLIESQFEYAPPIVSAVQEAAANASASERAAIEAQVRSEAAADRADAKVDDAINNGAALVRDEVKQDADRAVAARQAATQSESNAKASENKAATSESNAAASETNAKQSENNAGDYAAVATTATTEAVDAMTVASEAAASIGDSVSRAAASADSASQSEINAAQYESSAATHAQNATEAATKVGTAAELDAWARAAQEAADRVGTAEQVGTWASESSAAASRAEQAETNAKASETSAGSSAIDAKASEDAAAASAIEAGSHAESVQGNADRAQSARDEVVPLAQQVAADASATAAHRAHVDNQVSAIDTAFTESIPPYLQEESPEGLRNTYAGKRDLLLNVKDFGAAWDGVTDDTSAINACADFARDNGGTVYFPAGKGRVAGKVIIYGSLTCDGEVVMNGGDAAGIQFQKSSPSVTLDGLSGLTKGAVRISGLPDRSAGTLYLQNVNEPIINRYSGSGAAESPYYKAEVSPVTALGTLKYPLANTYVDEGAVTALFDHEEMSIVVSGLRVTIVGDARATLAQSRVFITRSNVTLNDLEVYNFSSVEQSLPVVVRDCANVEFNRPKISGFYHSSGGYGIMATHTADVRVRDADISEVRHAISGQKNKALQIDGGKYEGGIDDHWTYGISISGITGIIRSEHLTPSHIHTAGHGDVTVRDCTLFGGISVMSIRSDTPELDGAVRLEGINWTTDVSGELLRGIRYYSTSLPARDYGRQYLWTPHLLSIKNWEIKAPPSKPVNIVQATGMGFEHHGWGDIMVEDIKLLSGAGLTVYVETSVGLRPEDDRGARITCRNVEFVEGQQYPSVWVQNQSGVDANEVQAAEVDISDCQNVAFTFAENAVKRVYIRDSSILKIHRSGTPAPIPQLLTFRNNIMKSVWMTGWWRGHFFHNIWRGGVRSDHYSVDGRTLAYMGNLHEVGSTGFPSHPDGYRDTGSYQAEPANPDEGGTTVEV